MKVLVILFTLSLILGVQEPPVTSDDPDLVVLKFNWSKYRQNNDLIHSVADPGPSMNEPMSIKPAPPRNEPAEVRNRRDMQERRADMIAAERSAASTTSRNQDHYFLHLEVKNTGTNVIKNVVWEYQPTAETADAELRQYVCSLKAKPNERKTFELITPFSPVKVINAETKPGQPKDGRVVINRLEYSDGTIWKRKGWSVLIPADVTEKIQNGKCISF
jgi:hypothetical protein